MFGTKEKHHDLEYFSLYDVKGQVYNEPILALNELDIVRVIQNIMRRPGPNPNTWVTNPEDFQLFKLGTYAKKTGRIEAHAPLHIVNLNELSAQIKAELSTSGIAST